MSAFRSIAALALSLTLSAAVSAPTATATHDDPVFPDVASNPENLIVRLVDLSRAYRVGNDGYCSEGFYYEEGRDPELYQLDLQRPSYTCEIDFRRRGYANWGDLDKIVSRATVFASLEHAVMAFDDATRGSGGPLRRAADQHLGDASALYVSRSTHGYQHALMAWRTGRTFSVVHATGESKRWVVRNLLRLARVQQSRIESPTAVAPADNERRSIPIVDPTVQTPIYWLGTTFQGPDLPDRHLHYTRAGDPGYGPDWIANVDYGYISLGTWTHRAWRRFKQSRTGRQVLHGDPCGATERVSVRNGYAVLLSRRSVSLPLRPTARKQWRRCHPRWPEWTYIDMAYVRYRNVVVSVNIPQCFHCIAGTGDRYDSPEGMRAIVKGLRPLRPSP